jgi:hypothetical protein
VLLAICESRFLIPRTHQVIQFLESNCVPAHRVRKHQSGNSRAGSLGAARQAGSRQAETAVIAIIATADPNTHGS